VGATVNALEQAMSNLMGGAAAPVENGGAGRIRGLDGDQPAYQGTQISPDDFRAPPPGTGMAQTPTGPSPEDLRQALRYGPGTQEAPAPHYVTSAATEKALNQLKHIDTEMMAQAAAFQKHLGNKIDTADSLVSVSEIDKTVAGECAKGGGCSDSERTAIANVIMNRINIAAANKPNLDIHDVLDAFDANMQAENQRKGGVPDNKVYATADVGTPQYAAGVTALNAALSGNLPKDIPDSVRLATNYYNPDSSNPSWSDNSTLGTQYGPHKFLSVNGSTPAQVQAANDKVAAGDIKADISFYKGMNDSASPQAAKIQTEVTRSLTVAGRKVDITTQSTGNAQGPSIHQSTQGSGSSHQIGGVGTPQQAPATAQKTSLDDPTNSNVPSPADVRKFITARGWPADKPIDGQYAYRLSNIVARAETATGKKAPSNYFSSTYRSPEEQAQIKATSLGHSIVYNGVTYPPDMSNKYVGTNFKAAWPGDSPHQYGEAVDTVDTSKMKDPQAKAAADAINHYIQSNTPMHIALRDAGIDPKTGLPPVSADPSQTGLERVTNDQNHVQLAGFKPRAADNTMNKLDSSIGAGAVPDTTSAPKSWLSNIPSLADIKQKAADAVKAVTPSEATKQKLSWVSGLPTWMQSVVVSVYTGKGGTAPSDNGNTGSHGGSSFFPEAQRATTTISSRTITKINVTQIPWWQQYQAKLNAIKQSKQQQSI
jgi:hypothetical protein